ncbi:hypothetical protein HYPSUDRAFT_412156 [Hypholoma sublateritium FD-334 SS-4]|uniref:Uncharacterized protein n=1 Tax=Hypholoma sublateritium (strain FD-334 SS-4) TaxID=945553 RepID=A0A0D2LVP4_HYPSF|nr:hypothetical protein HYPSUDRAFT_412156 [Hypholoma sublateritium FD-334 SS-4]
MNSQGTRSTQLQARVPTRHPPYGGIPGQQQQQPQQQQQQVPAGYGVVPQGGYAGHQPGAPYSQQGPTPYPVQGQQLQQQQQQPIQQQQQPLQQQQQQQPLQQPLQPVQHQQPLQQPIQHQPVQQQPIQQPIQAQPVQQQQPLHQPVQALPAQQLPTQQQPIQRQQPSIQQQQPVQLHQEPAYATASSPQPQPQNQPEAQAQPQPEPQPQPQPQTHAAPQQPISGPPPYVYNPSYTYADPNVQAWAQYYAQGGLDKAGSVYFISIPGVTDAQDNSAPAAQSPDGQQQQQQQQQPQQQPQQQQPQQTLGRQSSLQAQAYQAHPADNEVAYGAAAVTSVRATSPAQQQQQPQPQTTGFQLHDQPAFGVYQQPALVHSPAADVNAAPLQASSPTRGTFGVVRQNSAGSPTQGASTPAWVLPKKTGAVAQGPAGDASYFPPTAGLGGLTLTDPGSGSAVSG